MSGKYCARQKIIGTPSAMQNNLTVIPFDGFARASVKLPGSKSITNRAMILAALSGGRTIVRNALFSRDTEVMASALNGLGYSVKFSGSDIEIASQGFESQAGRADIFVGNAGTAARFLTAFAALKKGGEYTFDSDEAMYRRPQKGLIDALKFCGTEFEFLGRENAFPFKMRTHGISADKVKINASESSQLLSALLLVAPWAGFDVYLEGDTVSKPFVNLTLRVMEGFGIKCLSDNYKFSFKRSNEFNDVRVYDVEPDATAASYFAALPSVVGGAVILEGLGSGKLIQGDLRFIEVLEKLGLVKTDIVGGDILVRGVSNFIGKSASLDFNDISDTFLTLAAISMFFGNPIKISGLSHTRKQECDRVEAVRSQIAKFCDCVSAEKDSLSIKPFGRENFVRELSSHIPVEVETFDDHRMAMSFAVSGCFSGFGRPFISIENPGCVSKTWREFFEVLNGAREVSKKFIVVAVDGGAAVGKSSVSRESSAALNYMHVDTGAHYRTVAYGLLERNLSSDDIDGIAASLKNLKLDTVLEGNSARMSVDGKLVPDSEIRTQRINSEVAKFAAIPELRAFLRDYQRGMVDVAKANGFDGLIMEGRDIGSVIFPDANLRIFLDADEETRAARRANEGISDSISKRDMLDKTRKTAPLVCPEGAVRIDTSHMAKSEVVALTLQLIIKSRY